MSYKILIVDDDLEISKLLINFLEKFSFTVEYASNGIIMKRMLKDNIYDIILLDIMLPGDDGYKLCQYIHGNYSSAIVMISALEQDSDRILALEMGADDYLTKPFNTRELLARIKAILRRSKNIISDNSSNGRLVKIDQIYLDKYNHTITDNNLTIPLSKKEYDLLLVFLKHPNQILSRSQLIDQIYNDKYFDPFDRSIDVLVGRLRKKLEINKNNILQTVRSVGYKFVINKE
jgi:two-component system OmpR family response regulator